MRICLLSLRYLTNGHGISNLYSGIQEAYFRMIWIWAQEAWGGPVDSGPRSTGSIYPRSSRDLGGKKAKSPLSLRSSRLMPGTSPIASLSPRDDSLRAIALGPSFHATA